MTKKLELEVGGEIDVKILKLVVGKPIGTYREIIDSVYGACPLVGRNEIIEDFIDCEDRSVLHGKQYTDEMMIINDEYVVKLRTCESCGYASCLDMADYDLCAECFKNAVGDRALGGSG